MLQRNKNVDFFLYGEGKFKLNQFPSAPICLPSVSANFSARFGTLLATSLLWKNRRMSRAHFFRAVCTFGTKKLQRANSTMIIYDDGGVSAFKRFIVRSTSQSLILSILSFVRKNVISLILARRFKKCGISSDKYRYVLIPFSGLLTPEFEDLVCAFKKLRIETVAIQENWDNLSSKTFISVEPDFFLVWGAQSRGHLRSIHSKIKTKVFEIGSPRFIPYFTSETFEHKDTQPIESPYILVTGTGDGIDDEFILKETMLAVKQSGLSLQFGVVYRPHPFTRHSIEQSRLSALIDDGLKIDFGSSASYVFYHCPLVKNASIVINQFSTILLEALVCNVKVLLPTFVSRPVSYDYSMAIHEWHHFLGLRNMPNVTVSFDPKNFIADLLLALEESSFESSEAVSWMIRPGDSRKFLLDFDSMYDSLT